MEAVMRKPYQGVLNIVRFNWHFYLIAIAIVFVLLLTSVFSDKMIFWISISFASGTIIVTLVSLCVSYYVYDRSALYNFSWVKEISEHTPESIVNIHAGFDETSSMLKKNFPAANLNVYDFYDPNKHTEISIERARTAYPPFEGTLKISTSSLPAEESSIDAIFNIFALHEIRVRTERINFLKLQVEALRNEGRCIVVEHLRDVPNFLAYNIGFLHFFPEREWSVNFFQAGLKIERKFKITPFISVFILKKLDGNTP